MTEQYTGHGANTGGLQLHSVGDIYPMILVYYPATEEFAVLNGSTGVTSERRHPTAGAATLEAMELNSVAYETIAKQVLLRCLHMIHIKLTADTLPNRQVGLCSHIAAEATEAYALTWDSRMLQLLRTQSKELMATWPEFSGCKVYPVPHEKDDHMEVTFATSLTESADDPQSRASAAYCRYRDMYDTATEYGLARRRLLQYMIDALQFELKYDQ